MVWFGEVPEGLGEIAKVLNWTELFIVVGTSSLVRCARVFLRMEFGTRGFALQVHPAASFQEAVKKRGGKVAVFNLERSEGDDNADFLFLGSCDETLPNVFGV